MREESEAIRKAFAMWSSQEQIPKHQNVHRPPGKSYTNPNPNPHPNPHPYGMREESDVRDLNRFLPYGVGMTGNKINRREHIGGPRPPMCSPPLHKSIVIPNEVRNLNPT